MRSLRNTTDKSTHRAQTHAQASGEQQEVKQIKEERDISSPRAKEIMGHLREKKTEGVRTHGATLVDQEHGGGGVCIERRVHMQMIRECV